jgi:hypothetical protein
LNFFHGTSIWTQDLHLKPLYQPFFVKCFFKIGFPELFAQAGFEWWSSWSLSPEKLGLQVWATSAWLRTELFEMQPKRVCGLSPFNSAKKKKSFSNEYNRIQRLYNITQCPGCITMFVHLNIWLFLKKNNSDTDEIRRYRFKTEFISMTNI